MKCLNIGKEFGVAFIPTGHNFEWYELPMSTYLKVALLTKPR